MSELPFKGLLLVCDMDGTLLNSQNKVSNENANALKYFVQGGGMFTIASGRTASIIKEYLQVLPVNVPAIVINGAQIYDFKTRSVLYRWSLEKDVKQIIIELISNYPQIGMEIFSEKGVYVVKENKFIKEHRSRERIFPGIFSHDEVSKPWYKVVLGGEHEEILHLEEELRRKIGSMTQTVFCEWNLFDLIHRNASKGIALKELCGMLNISCSNVIAVGDNLNDLDMFKAAGTGIAVDNAHEELKKYAKRCTVHHDNHAVADVIGWIEKCLHEGYGWGTQNAV